MSFFDNPSEEQDLSSIDWELSELPYNEDFDEPEDNDWLDFPDEQIYF